MPITEALLCIFNTSHGTGRIGQGTLTNWVTGLELWYSINCVPWLGKGHLNHAIKGATSVTPSSSSCPLHLLVLISHLQSLHATLDLKNTFDASVYAIACISFWSQCRLIELCLDELFDPLHHPSRGSHWKEGTASNGLNYGAFFTPHTKTKPRGVWNYWTCSGYICSADKAFNTHIGINSNILPKAPLFAFKTSPMSWEPMHWSWFMEHRNEIWLASGHTSLMDYSFRIRGTMHLLLLGVDLFIVMVQGHWNSDAFLAYWHHCE